MEKKANPFYCVPAEHSYLRRAKHHDYTRPARYMITLHKSPVLPILSNLSGKLTASRPNDNDFPSAIPTPTGSIFHVATELWLERYPQMRVDGIVIMPDHIHFLLRVTDNLPNGLSLAIANLMGKASKLYSEAVHSAMPSDKEMPELISFFSKGFNDRIAYSDEQYRVMGEYICDNPRRLMMKRAFPDLYLTRWVIKFGHIQLMALGNIYLLKNPHIQVVRFSRQFDSLRLEENDRAYEVCLHNRGAFIYPFIHPNEKQTRDRAIANGGNIIRICSNGFSERFAPAKSEFDLMGSERLLLIAPMEHDYHRREMKYSYAQQLNRLAEALASHPADLTISRFR